MSSAKRLPQLPDLPTLRELGYPDIADHDLDHDQRRRPGCRRTIVDAVNREVRAIAVKPELKKHFENEGEEPRLMSPAELTDFVQAEVARWVPVVRAMVKQK